MWIDLCLELFQFGFLQQQFLGIVFFNELAQLFSSFH